MSFRLIATRRVPAAWTAYLAARGVAVSEATEGLDRAAFAREAAACDGILAFLTDPIDAALIDACPRLKVVANVAVGTDNVDLAAAARRGVWVTNTPDCLTDAVADLTMGLILAAARRIVEADRFVREGRFQGWRWDLFQGLELAGATLGVVGFGRTGRAVARRAAAFGMRIVAVARRGVDPAAWPNMRFLSLDDLLALADVVTLHVPLTPQTRGLIGAEALARMKRGAILVNMARGPVVDEAALVQALREGRLTGAALDVFEREPLLAPGLAELPNVVLTPHIGSATVAAREQMMRIACDNVVAVARGESPAQAVTPPPVERPPSGR